MHDYTLINLFIILFMKNAFEYVTCILQTIYYFFMKVIYNI
jgi:hypothetical protein